MIIMRVVYLFIMMAFLAGCQQSAERASIESQEIMDSFKRVDRQLNDSSYNDKNNPSITVTDMTVSVPVITDTSVIGIKNTGKQIERFVHEATRYLADKPKQDKTVCNLYFIKQRKGFELFTLLQQYQVKLSQVDLKQSVRNHVDSILQPLLSPLDFKSWSETRFKSTNPSDAIAMLNRVNLDITRLFLHVKIGK